MHHYTFWFYVCLADLITGRNEVLAKVIFSQASVILFTGVGGVWSRGVSNFSAGGGPPNFRGVSNFPGGGVSPPEYGQRSAGAHLTGMHSCII